MTPGALDCGSDGPRTDPLISVIIPTYARPVLVRRAIESVVRQSYTQLEILVVDDCSPDDTRQVVETIGDPRIRYMRHACHRGIPSVSRNTGVRAAAGEYLAFLDDDDEWKPPKLERQLQCARRMRCDAVLCGSVGSTGIVRRHRRACVTLTDLRRGNDFAPGSGLLVRAPLMGAVLFDESIGPGEDWDVLIRLAHAGTIGYVDEPLCIVNEGDHRRVTNRARNGAIRELEQRMAVIRKHGQFFGPFWSAYHEAEALLSYLQERHRKLAQIAYAARRCGLAPVSAVLLAKIRRRVQA